MADNALLQWLPGMASRRNSLLDGAPMYQGGQQMGNPMPAANFVPQQQPGLAGYGDRALNPQTPNERMAANVVRGFAESPAAIKMAGRAPVDHIEDILSAIRENPDEAWGLRVIDGPAPARGASLPPSRHWVDGEPTEALLDGTSAVGVLQDTPQEVERALRQLGVTRDGRAGPNGYYPGETVMLVRAPGGLEHMNGEDIGERILRDATVERAYRKQNAQASWFADE